MTGINSANRRGPLPPRTGIALAVALAAVGCADRPRGVLQPVTTAVPGTSQVDLVVATTREPSRAPGEVFSGERGDGLAFADIGISIPPASARRIGEVQWPRTLPSNPATDFTTVRANRLTLAEAQQLFRTRVQRTPHGRVMVFVHGYNNRFEDAVYGFAQIMHDSRAPAVPVLFTWPSRGRLLAYGYDRESTNYSRDALETVLDAIASNPSVREISILAHSMGNWLTMEALRQSAIRRGRIHPKIRDVMLAAPDIDVDVFRTQVAQIGPAAPRFTLFVSRDDRALAVSQRVWQSTARLGAIDPRQEPTRSVLERNRITVLDLTEISTGDGLRHGKFAESPDVVRFIGARLAEGQSLPSGQQSSAADRIGQVLTGTASRVGSAAGAVISVPFAIIDPASRESLADRLEEVTREGAPR